MSAEKEMDQVNNALRSTMIKEIDKNKKIGCDLTGGKDSRAILSILLNQGIYPTVYTIDKRKRYQYNIDGDVEISYKIAEEYGLEQKISKWNPEEVGIYNWHINWYKKKFSEVDIFFSGAMGNVYLSPFHTIWDMHHEFKWAARTGAPYIYTLLKEIKQNIVMPLVDPTVVGACEKVPMYYRHAGQINIHIIKKNKPELLKYPFTNFIFPENIFGRLKYELQKRSSDIKRFEYHIKG